MRIFVIAFAVIAATSAASISSDYLPPVADNSLTLGQEYLAPVELESKTALSDDGYRYKTVRKLRLRHRRDVSEITSQQYLPPAADSAESVAVEAAQEPEALGAEKEKTVLADDGYRYKIVRRTRYRLRRDVNELPANEYLPPTEQSAQSIAVEAAEAPEASQAPEASEAPEVKTVLADDGYRYKVVRRIRYRRRRDVHELPANEYLPPTEQSAQSIAVEAAEASEASEAPEVKTVLADDGYHYKIVRRIRYRRRRDVNEQPANEYLPPTEQSAQSIAVEAAEAPEASEAPEVKTVLADDGYHYKIVRHIRYRRRRDVNELPANEYLPPTEQSAQSIAVEVAEAPEASEAPEVKTVLADDGYRYKVVRRIRYRRRRDVNELPANEYLPPTEQSAESIAVEVAEAPEASEAAEEKTLLADDGYRYQVVRRIRYRHRRDVNELPTSEYLPPTEEPVEALAVEAAETPEASEKNTVLADDGYRYKVVRRIRYRRRRDVNELPANEYLPPTESSSDSVAVELSDVPEEKPVLADDGYRYKVVRRLKYRRH